MARRIKYPMKFDLNFDRETGESDTRRLKARISKSRIEIKEGSVRIERAEDVPDIFRTSNYEYRGNAVLFDMRLSDVSPGEADRLSRQTYMLSVFATPKPTDADPDPEEIERACEVSISLLRLRWTSQSFVLKDGRRTPTGSLQVGGRIEVEPDGASGFELELSLERWDAARGQYVDDGKPYHFTHYFAPGNRHLDLSVMSLEPVPWDPPQPKDQRVTWWTSRKALPAPPDITDLPIDTSIRVQVFADGVIRNRTRVAGGIRLVKNPPNARPLVVKRIPLRLGLSEVTVTITKFAWTEQTFTVSAGEEKSAALLALLAQEDATIVFRVYGEYRCPDGPFELRHNEGRDPGAEILHPKLEIKRGERKLQIELDEDGRARLTLGKGGPLTEHVFEDERLGIDRASPESAVIKQFETAAQEFVQLKTNLAATDHDVSGGIPDQVEKDFVAYGDRFFRDYLEETEQEITDTSDDRLRFTTAMALLAVHFRGYQTEHARFRKLRMESSIELTRAAFTLVLDFIFFAVFSALDFLKAAGTFLRRSTSRAVEEVAEVGVQELTERAAREGIERLTIEELDALIRSQRAALEEALLEKQAAEGIEEAAEQLMREHADLVARRRVWSEELARLRAAQNAKNAAREAYNKGLAQLRELRDAAGGVLPDTAAVRKVREGLKQLKQVYTENLATLNAGRGPLRETAEALGEGGRALRQEISDFLGGPLQGNWSVARNTIEGMRSDAAEAVGEAARAERAASEGLAELQARRGAAEGAASEVGATNQARAAAEGREAQRLAEEAAARLQEIKDQSWPRFIGGLVITPWKQLSYVVEQMIIALRAASTRVRLSVINELKIREQAAASYSGELTKTVNPILNLVSASGRIPSAIAEWRYSDEISATADQLEQQGDAIPRAQLQQIRTHWEGLVLATDTSIDRAVEKTYVTAVGTVVSHIVHQMSGTYQCSRDVELASSWCTQFDWKLDGLFGAVGAKKAEWTERQARAAKSKTGSARNLIDWIDWLVWALAWLVRLVPVLVLLGFSSISLGPVGAALLLGSTDLVDISRGAYVSYALLRYDLVPKDRYILMMSYTPLLLFAGLFLDKQEPSIEHINRIENDATYFELFD